VIDPAGGNNAEQAPGRLPFADLAKTAYQSGDLDAARRILEKAEIGYAHSAGNLVPRFL
jgi:hypothetical protein